MKGRALCATAAAVFAASGVAPAHALDASAASVEGVPRVAHVVVWMLENESFDTTWSASSPAHYLNSLVRHGAFVPQYYATGHVSLDNYVALTSGIAGPQIASTYTDCAGINLFACTQEVSAAALTSGSIADQLDATGQSWKEYADGSSAPCVHDSYSPSAGPDSFQGDQAPPESSTANGDYADRHVPFLYYSNIVGNQARCDAHLRPFTEMQTDMAHDTLPAYSFVTPDTCNDGHDKPCAGGRGPGGLASADLFLTAHLPALLAYLQAHDGLLLITVDEGSAGDTSGCCHGGPAGQTGFGGRVGLLALGPMVRTGAISSKQYDHASLLRTIEDSMGITTHLNNAASSTPITDIWSAPSVATVSPAPSAAPSAPAATTPITALPNTAASAAPAAVAGLGAVALLTAASLGRRRRRGRPPARHIPD